MEFKNLYIKYCNPDNPLDSFTLQYKLRDNSVVPKWCERIQSAQTKYSIDDPGRFYGFGTIKEQQCDAISRINSCIETINTFEHIIDRKLVKVNDQDTLNYLHHIFEVYHGLLDQQTHEFWQLAPGAVRRALADLNILVHRCESVQRSARSRHVITYYGLPKNKLLDVDDYKLFTDQIKFGTVYLNYVEIGKTLENLAIDNDQYISDKAFRPFCHYSADFNVQFWANTNRQVKLLHVKIKAYYDANIKFFKDKQLSWGHPHLASGLIPLADLVYSGSRKELLEELKTHQHVDSVVLI
jgi:hypothetical protein